MVCNAYDGTPAQSQVLVVPGTTCTDSPQAAGHPPPGETGEEAERRRAQAKEAAPC